MLLEAVSRYVEKGLQIVPVSGKQVKIKNWPEINFNDDIESYNWEGIGLKCGIKNNIIVLDMDTLELELQEKISSLLPPLYLGRRGNPQKLPARFFLYNGELNQKLKNIEVELLSTGTQIVLPPSIHSICKIPYEWVERSILDIDIDELPILDPLIWKELVKLDTATPVKITADKKVGPGWRNNTLVSMATAALTKGTPAPEVAHEIKSYDHAHHKPPLFSDPLDPQMRRNTPEENALNFVKRIEKSLNRKNIPMEDPTANITIDIPALTNSPTITLVDPPSSPEKETDSYKRIKLPHFRGIAQQLFTYIHQHSPVPRTRFSVASTLACMGTILGNKVICKGMYTNLYLVITSHSGSGKDYPLSFPYQLFKHANQKFLIGGAPESDSGILHGLTKNPTRLDVFDEASRLFIMMNDEKNIYTAKMADVYATLYTSCGKYYSGKTLKDGLLGECESPCISLFCALTIEDFRKHFNIDLVAKGIGARFLFFPDNEYKDISPLNISSIPEEIVEFTRSIRSLPAVELKISDELYKKYIAIVNDYRRSGYQNGQELMGPIYNRLGENLLKLAMIDSISLDKRSITSDSLDWAHNWINAYINTLDKFLALNVFSSKQGYVLSAIEELIKRHSINGISSSDLLRSSIVRKYNLQSKDLKVYLDTLLDSEKIYSKNPPSKGRKKIQYFHADFIKE